MRCWVTGGWSNYRGILLDICIGRHHVAVHQADSGIIWIT